MHISGFQNFTRNIAANLSSVRQRRFQNHSKCSILSSIIFCLKHNKLLHHLMIFFNLYVLNYSHTLDLRMWEVREGGVVADVGEHAHGGEAKVC